MIPCLFFIQVMMKSVSVPFLSQKEHASMLKAHASSSIGWPEVETSPVILQKQMNDFFTASLQNK
jgi:hypothetical protein